MNAIILAGDRESALPFCGMNKAFLLLEGWPLFIHVLTALNQAKNIDTIYIVGPRKAIMEALEKSLSAFLFTKKIEVLEQKKTLLENSIYAYQYASAGKPPNDPALFMPADIPLVTAYEIDTFIAMSDMRQYDYCLGMASEEHLTQFYPRQKEIGIKMPYLYLRDQVYRMNNLHIARLPSNHSNAMLQTIYKHRRQKNIWNRIKMVSALVKIKNARPLLFSYFLAQGAVLSARFGLHRMARLFRKSLRLEQVEKEISSLLQMRFKAIEVNSGGAALDIDDASSYKIMVSAFRKWHEALMSKQPEHRLHEACPFQDQCHGIETVSPNVAMTQF
jgi:GTP:adenosylcobinamide-phosphate guanylyltransferase